MSFYEFLMSQYPYLNIKEDYCMPVGISGLYFDNNVLIKKSLDAYTKTGVLAEEIGHHETSYGDITILDDVQKRKQEVVARRWGWKKVIPIKKIIECYEKGHTTTEDICLYLEVTPKYLYLAIDYYKVKYGGFCMYEDYVITFDPLNVVKMVSNLKA